MMLARSKRENDSNKFQDTEIMIVETPTFDVPNQHLIKVTACWRSMSANIAPDIVILSIADDKDAHVQEQNHHINSKDTGQAGGEMSRVLKVLPGTQGDIKPGKHSFQLRAIRDKGEGTIRIQAAKTYPAEIRVEDLGFIPPND
jgi:hypothetical protein